MNTYTLITGASSGMGMAFAKHYAALGQNVILVARSKDRLYALASELENQYQIHAKVIICDLSKANAAQAIYQEVEKSTLTVSTLVNDAGFATTGLFEDTDFSLYRDQLQVNALALTELTYLFLPKLMNEPNGTVINIASCAAFTPFPYASVYAATKSYVLYLTESLSYEYRKQPIRFLAVCPGATQTRFFDHFSTLTNRMRTPEDVVHSTFKALKHKKKVVCTDSVLAKLSLLLPRLASRNVTRNIIGSIGEKAWGNTQRGAK